LDGGTIRRKRYLTLKILITALIAISFEAIPQQEVQAGEDQHTNSRYLNRSDVKV